MQYPAILQVFDFYYFRKEKCRQTVEKQYFRTGNIYFSNMKNK